MIDEPPNLGFAVWMECRGRFGIQVKGGRYSVDGTIWTLWTNQGVEHVSSPLTRARDAAVAVRYAVNRVLGFKTYHPGAHPHRHPAGPSIDEWSTERKVELLFGADGLVDRLLALADRMGVQTRPRPVTS